MTTTAKPASGARATAAETTAAAATTLPKADATALADALRAEDAAVYAYGMTTAFALPTRHKQIAEHAAAHRARRAAVTDMLEAAGEQVPSAAAGYTFPFPVDDPSSAARLAATAEHDCAVAWRSALEHAETSDVRDFAVTALSDSAVQAGNWRVALGIDPPTVAFPGTPDDG